MAQATVSSISALAVEQAAAAIVHLINERPVSPRKDEVEAIIARAVGAPQAATPIFGLPPTPGSTRRWSASTNSRRNCPTHLAR